MISLYTELFIALAEKNNKKNENYIVCLNSYLSFLNNHLNENKMEEIIKYLENLFVLNNEIFDWEEYKKIDKIYILAIILFKSINRTSLVKTLKDVNFLSSDDILNEACDYYQNIHIFYFEKKVLAKEIHLFRSEIFKIIKLLEMESIVKSRKNFKNNKTIYRWSFNFENLIMPDISHLKISLSPLKLISLDDDYYLLGDFFENVKKVFIENIKSNYSFKLNDLKYLESLRQNKIYINVNDVKSLTYIIKEKEGSIFDINNYINIINISNLEISEYIKKCKKKIDNENIKYFESAIYNKKIESQNDLENAVNEIFLKFCKLFLETKNKKINISDEEFLSWFYDLISEHFKEMSLKLDFKDMDELYKWDSNFSEYGIESLIIKNKSPDLKIDMKLDSKSINFITYLINISKKEILEILIKNYRKLLKLEKYNINIFNKNSINRKEYFNIMLSVYMKYSTEHLKSSENILIRKEIILKESELKKNYSIISKKIHLYNILLLEKYLETEHLIKKTDKYGNVEVNFNFFFDFRGRLYYHSPISPTNNRMCRYIFNYGTVEKNKIIFKENKISSIIDRYISYIESFSKNKNIEITTNLEKEWIFWIMISIGKLKINKNSEEVDIEIFLKISLKLKENDLIDILDKIELNYYNTIIKNLKEEVIIRRTLLKDATASFFQNLIRILGSKNEEYLMIANLKSLNKWYDWYTHIIKIWKNNNENFLKIYEEEIKYFNRKILKKIIMTQPYSATYPTCYEYFIESMMEENNILISEDDSYTKIFKNFYSFLNDQLKKDGPFKYNGETLTKHFREILVKGDEIVILSKEKDSTNLTYFKTKTKYFDFIVKFRNAKHRISKKISEIDKNKVDMVKTLNAAKPNIVHFVDALLAREINKNIGLETKRYYISIHDSFMVDFTEVSMFIIISNIEINKDPFHIKMWNNTNVELFSIFIFL